MPASLRSLLTAHSLLLCSVVAGGLATPALAQDSAFLACARFEDRGQRIACLEDALEAATDTQAAPTASMAPPAASTAAPAAAATPAAPVVAVPATASNNNEERSLLDRIRNFGQSEPEVTVSIGDNGEDRLHDSIASLDKRNNLWIVTLSSGQVWRQTYPRNLLLREGDAISIDQEGIGGSFRLSTPRLSGFIRVERIK